MFALGIATVSCSINELETDNKYNIKEGVPTVTNLEICLNENRIITRTGASETVEKTRYSVYRMSRIFLLRRRTSAGCR